jgi:hypothetical protein
LHFRIFCRKREELKRKAKREGGKEEKRMQKLCSLF